VAEVPDESNIARMPFPLGYRPSAGCNGGGPWEC
jgi:hypothetical protein